MNRLAARENSYNLECRIVDIIKSNKGYGADMLASCITGEVLIWLKEEEERQAREATLLRSLSKRSRKAKLERSSRVCSRCQNADGDEEGAHGDWYCRPCYRLVTSEGY